MSIKIAHESPKSIFKQVQEVTDYDYALVHLFEEDSEYYDLFVEAKKQGREIILDNSIFELEEAFDADKFAYWIKTLKPDWYIIPDVLEDGYATCLKTSDWMGKYYSLPGKKIGVVQGRSLEEIKACYDYMDRIAQVDMIAISFDYSYYRESVPHPNKYVSWMLGRAKLLGDLLKDGHINRNKKHHLLGTSLPIEGMFYREYNWIYSMDTSNPCVHAMKNIPYSGTGLWTKESQKLVELIDISKEEIDINLVLNNIRKFRHFWNGNI